MRRLLVRLYPAAWRAEYGGELLDTLLRQPLTLGVAANVVWSAARQRLRDEEPWKIAGWPMLGVMISLLLWNIFTPVNYEMKERGDWLLWVIPASVGFWTYLRYNGQRSAAAAAARMWLMSSWPFAIAGVLIALGVLSSVVVQPLAEPVQIIAFKSFDRRVHGLPLIISPLVYAPLTALCGWLGGLAARLLRLTTSRRTASPAPCRSLASRR